MTEELGACIPDPAADRQYSEVELGDLISRFLRTLPRESRAIFIRRYVLAEPIVDIARQTGASESKVHSVLFRTRNRLREYLEREGVTV